SIYFAKPSWQTGTGEPADGKRDVPDLSFAASPNHDGYLVCSEDGANGAIQSSCTAGFRTGAGGTFTVVGGPSVAAPTFAAILALINESLGNTPPSGLGNVNPNLYTFAGSNPSAFHDVTTGNNIVPCTSGTPNCPATAPFQYGFSATAGYDQVTGLGSVDANKLTTAWAASRTASSVTIATVSKTSVLPGTPVSFAVAVTPSTGVGTVSFSTVNGGSTTVLGTVTLNTPYPPSQSGTATFVTSVLPVGSNSITATYEGDASDSISTSAATPVTVTVPFTLSPSLTTLSVSAGQPGISVITVAPVNGFNQAVNFNPT